MRRVVRDLNLESRFACSPTIRDKDGLAISSRNVQLSSDERTQALALPARSQWARRRTHKAATQSPPPAAPSMASQPDYVELVEVGNATLLATQHALAAPA